jgi:hypothetical protein
MDFRIADTFTDSLALDFHDEIIRIAGSNTLERLLQSIFAQIKAMWVQRKYTPMHLPQSCDDHEKLLEAFRLHDPDLAERGGTAAYPRPRRGNSPPASCAAPLLTQGPRPDHRVLRHTQDGTAWTVISRNWRPLKRESRLVLEPMIGRQTRSAPSPRSLR